MAGLSSNLSIDRSGCKQASVPLYRRVTLSLKSRFHFVVSHSKDLVVGSSNFMRHHQGDRDDSDEEEAGGGEGAM